MARGAVVRPQVERLVALRTCWQRHVGPGPTRCAEHVFGGRCCGMLAAASLEQHQAHAVSLGGAYGRECRNG